MSRLMQFIRSVAKFIVDSVRRPREQLTEGQHRVRYAWELALYCYRQLAPHRAEGMAAGLTYRTIFALIPVVVLGLVMFRVVGGLEDVQRKVEDPLFTFFGVPDIPAEYLVAPEPVESDSGSETLTPTGDAESDQKNSEPDASDAEMQLAGPESGTESDSSADVANNTENEDAATPTEADVAEVVASSVDATMAEIQDEPDKDAESKEVARASIRKSLQDVTTKVSNIDFASIGVIGLLLFIYAAVALADSVEHLSNRIFDAPRSRPIHLRVAIHWSIVTLGSGLLAMSLYMSSQVIDWFGEYSASSTGTLILRHLLSIAASWVLLFLLYALMPNTHVSVRAAAIGSFVSAFMWEAAKFGFQVYVGAAVPYAALYASLGLIPLFLFWIYITWLIVLFGLILTYTLQTLRGRRPHDEQEADNIRGNPDWMLPIMAEIATTFQAGAAITHQDIADRLGLPSRVVHSMTQRLTAAGWLRELAGTDQSPSGLTLSRPAERIRVSEILSVSHATRPESGHKGWEILQSLQEAEIKAAGDMTLDELVTAD